MRNMDDWDPIYSRKQYGRHVLTSIEITVTLQCNLRCEHCAVGDQLTREPETLSNLDTLLKELDTLPLLRTLSITGGEPTLSATTMERFTLPLLRYAHGRGLKTQINTNLTLPFERYQPLLPLIDVFHISYNYLSAEDFHAIAFERLEHSASPRTSASLFEALNQNIDRLAAAGAFVSAESLLTKRTATQIGEIHRRLAQKGIRRHEIHPLYPSDFAASMELLTLDEIRDSIYRLLDSHDPSIWILFGTLPFFWCSALPEDQALLTRLAGTKNVTVRNDPDGRNRLNINALTGSIVVQDFSPLAPVGRLGQDAIADIFDAWKRSEVNEAYDCYCPEAGCTGPNILVADAYYPNWVWPERRAVVPERSGA